MQWYFNVLGQKWLNLALGVCSEAPRPRVRWERLMEILILHGRFHRIYTTIHFCNFFNKIAHRESSSAVLDRFILMKIKNLFRQAKKIFLEPFGRIFHFQMSTRDNWKLPKNEEKWLKFIKKMLKHLQINKRL